MVNLSEVQESEELIVTVSSDKSSYLFDETAINSRNCFKKIFIEKPIFILNQS